MLSDIITYIPFLVQIILYCVVYHTSHIYLNVVTQKNKRFLCMQENSKFISIGTLAAFFFIKKYGP